MSGWLTRGENGLVVFWGTLASLKDVWKTPSGRWEYNGTVEEWNSLEFFRSWGQSMFKAQYTGIPRKGRAVYVTDMQIIV